MIEEKDLPEKPKGRERSGTNKSSKDGGKKSVFGFMTGELGVACGGGEFWNAR